MKINLFRPIFGSFLVCFSLTIFAESPSSMLVRYRDEARKTSADFQEFSIERGKKFYLQAKDSASGQISCASCHTVDPSKAGQTRAGKSIDPMAPSVNPKRFTDVAKVDKWFTRNCDDVLKRTCTAQEKGDFITYLVSIK